MLNKKDTGRTKCSVGQNDLTRMQSLQESSSTSKTSMSQKSFSHELGPRGGIRASNLRARSYSDLKVFYNFSVLSSIKFEKCIIIYCFTTM